MDLLRLVLAHQPLEKLRTLPKLDDRFWKLRVTTLLHKEVKEKDFPLFFTWMGELSTFIPEEIGLDWMRDRAIFIRAALEYVYYASTNNVIRMLPLPNSESPVGVVRALETGIPEIQAAAIATGWLSDQEDDYRTIPWTPKLKAAVLRYGEKQVPLFGGRTETRHLLEGLPFRVPLPIDYGSVISEFTHGNEITTRIPELEDAVDEIYDQKSKSGNQGISDQDIRVMVESGYGPILVDKMAYQRESFQEQIKLRAVVDARIETLRKLQHIQMSHEDIGNAISFIMQTPITRNLVTRVETVFADTSIFSALDPTIQQAYRILMGYQIRVPVDASDDILHLSLKVGLPLYDENVSTNDLNSAAESIVPHSQDICYDPNWWAVFLRRKSPDADADSFYNVSDTMLRKAYTIGQPDIIHLYLLENFYETVEPPLYRQILSEFV